MVKEGKKFYQLASSPLKFDFRPRDILQVIVGATILAVPVAFTEETWRLGEVLPLSNIIWLMFMSFLFVGTFVYYNYYRGSFKEHWGEFLKRSLSTYIFAFIVVGLILIAIQKAPWQTDFLLAFKRTVIVTLPASMSAAIADMIK